MGRKDKGKSQRGGGRRRMALGRNYNRKRRRSNTGASAPALGLREIHREPHPTTA